MIAIRKVALIPFMFFDSLIFVQILIFTITLLFSEISRVTGKNELVQNQGFSDFDRMRFINPSHMVSPNSTSNFTGWNSLSHEVSTSVFMFYSLYIIYVLL